MSTMGSAMDPYQWADSAINACPKYGTGFTQLLADQPFLVSSAIRDLYETRLPLIRSFQRAAVNLFRASLDGEADPMILHWLMNETPDSLGIAYHRTLEERHFTLPVFFRTDEVRPGRIIEINCPAALWGELQLAFDYAAAMGSCLNDVAPAEQYADQLEKYLQGTPIVHHYLDHASAPGSWRYFIEKTRPRVRYWGIDRGIKLTDCNFIRHQGFMDLWADYHLTARLAMVNHGLAFDYPPTMLFDQKATLVLPFWSMTRELFADDVRNLFPFTTPLLPQGIELPDGSSVTIEEFSHRARSQRKYYLKYAGSNVALNWGSKAVYRLSNMSSSNCLNFLRQCLSQYPRGQIWLLQKEETQDNEITYRTRDGKRVSQQLRASFGGFYGPGGCLGVLALHGRHNKVHGRADTVISYVSTSSGDHVQT